MQYINEGKLIFGVFTSRRKADFEKSISVFNEIKKNKFS